MIFVSIQGRMDIPVSRAKGSMSIAEEKKKKGMQIKNASKLEVLLWLGSKNSLE